LNACLRAFAPRKITARPTIFTDAETGEDTSIPSTHLYYVTGKGKELVHRYVSGEDIA
jgi:hypothetical protein